MHASLKLILLSLASLASIGFEAIGYADDGTSKASMHGSVQTFLNTYCIDCHNDDESKGDRSFESLASEINNDNILVDYQDILDQLNLSEMPPSDAEQPGNDERMRAVASLTKAIERFHASRTHTSNQSVLRRLNSREYRNTIRDLLELETTIFDPTRNFPRDQTIEHLDNNAESLVTSSHLLKHYLDAADQVIDKALWPLNRPTAQTWTFKNNFRQQPEIDNAHRQSNGWKYMTLYDVVGADKPEGAYGPIHAFASGVPFDGVYEIRFQAEAVNRLHPYDASFIGIDRDQPFRLGIVAGNKAVGELHLPQPVEPLLAEIELADERRWYTQRIRLDKGYTPRFTFRNGLMDVRELWTKLIKKYPDQFAPNIRGIVDMRINAIMDGKLPQIRIHEIAITGPIIDKWPTAGQKVLLGDDFDQLSQADSLAEDMIRDHVKRFASLAYRRTATESEIDRVIHLIHIRQQSGHSAIDSLADGFKMILCSPSFLYLDESDVNDRGELSQHALAARLSYFLWSSMPDSELSRMADQGRLSDEDELRRQTRRMLADPKSDAMIDGFIDSWLVFRELGSAPPDRNAFPDFYRHDLGTAMRTETRMFFRYLLDENLALQHFIDADFTFVNRSLANLYQIEPPQTNEFSLVHLTDRRRGGLLGQSGVLTVTANGIDTSPVVRGVWMLENLLGTPPSPPPPDVEPLDPDTRGAKTIREQLAKHREVPTCYECHRKIDPLGFALENFDAIGRWRDRYDRKATIDSSGELPGGQTFSGIEELKQILLKREPQFVRTIAEKMLAYATGRTITPGDRPSIDKIASSAKGTRDLIEQIVLSEPFRKK